jgi:hypothetical protein
MPRKARLTVTGATHHLMSRGNGGMRIFNDDDDRRFFLSVLEKLLKKTDTFFMHGASWITITISSSVLMKIL